MSKPYIFTKIQSAPEHHLFSRFYNPMITNSLYNLINVKKQRISILRIKKSAQNRKKSTKFNSKIEKIGQNQSKNEQKTILLFVQISPKQSSDFKHSYPRNRIENVVTAPPGGALSIRDGQNLIYRDRGNAFLRPVGPSDFDCIHALRFAKPEIQPVMPL